MKFTAILYISAVSLISLVSAQPIVSITSPLTNTRYKAGQEAIISWVNPSVTTISQIVLAKGPSTALQPLMTIATNVNANAMQYIWKIPLDIESGTEYAFELGMSPDLAFAGPFTIEGGTGTGVPTDITTNTNASPPPGNSVNTSSSPPSNSGTPPQSNTGSNAQPHGGNASHTTSAADKRRISSLVFGVCLVAAVQLV
ncbi:hypothetical protein BDB01DRAFT_728577 [Pilobolus umbonatus]|nr:hypothetical protein BDB01DRAFT_728577 [Pilobolus umbonatus]